MKVMLALLLLNSKRKIQSGKFAEALKKVGGLLCKLAREITICKIFLYRLVNTITSCKIILCRLANILPTCKITLCRFANIILTEKTLLCKFANLKQKAEETTNNQKRNGTAGKFS